jgi:YD repeat-containing protein
MEKKLSKIYILILFIAIITNTPLLAATAQYTYDDLNRLIKVQYSDGAVIQYTYDAVGNRLTQQVQAPSGSAAASPQAGAAGSASSSASNSTAVDPVQESLTYTGAGVSPALAWPALLTRIRLAGSDSDLENLQGEIQSFLNQGAFSPGEKDEYQKEVAQELEARADFIRRTTAAAAAKAGTASPAGMDREQKDKAAPPHPKIIKEKEKIYTSDPESGVEKPQP